MPTLHPKLGEQHPRDVRVHVDPLDQGVNSYQSHLRFLRLMCFCLQLRGQHLGVRGRRALLDKGFRTLLMPGAPTGTGTPAPPPRQRVPWMRARGAVLDQGLITLGRLLEQARLRLQLGGQRLNARARAAPLQQRLKRRHVHGVAGAEVRQHLLRATQGLRMNSLRNQCVRECAMTLPRPSSQQQGGM